MRLDENRPHDISFTIKRRLYVGEQDDMSGNVYLPGYFHFMSLGHQDLFIELGHPMHDQINEGVVAAVRHATCDYLAPLRVGVEFEDRISVYIGENTSMLFRHQFVGTEDQRVYANGTAVRCWVDLNGFKKGQMPEWLKAYKK